MHDLFALLYFRRRVFKEINVMWKKTYSVVKHFIGVYRNLFFKGAKPVIVLYICVCLTALQQNVHAVWIWSSLKLKYFYVQKILFGILSVPDEGYFERTWWRLFWAYLMKVILSVPDEGYSRNSPCALNLISTFVLYAIDI